MRPYLFACSGKDQETSLNCWGPVFFLCPVRRMRKTWYGYQYTPALEEEHKRFRWKNRDKKSGRAAKTDRFHKTTLHEQHCDKNYAHFGVLEIISEHNYQWGKKQKPTHRQNNLVHPCVPFPNEASKTYKFPPNNICAQGKTIPQQTQTHTLTHTHTPTLIEEFIFLKKPQLIYDPERRFSDKPKRLFIPGENI